MLINPEEDINIAEAMDIIADCETKMEIAGNSYLYGYMRGCSCGGSKLVPVVSLRQMTDDEWAEMARKNKLEREVSA